MLDHPEMRDVVVEVLARELEKRDGVCSGFVVMPDHVHAIVWFPQPGRLSEFMKSWKQATSLRLKKLMRGLFPNYASEISPDDPFWQAKYYPFNLYSDEKARARSWITCTIIRLRLAWSRNQPIGGTAQRGFTCWESRLAFRSNGYLADILSLRDTDNRPKAPVRS
jgi:REP element-mobilizing transposase RayT